MSHSPIEPDAPRESYLAGWSAVNKLLRRGHSWSGHEHNCAYRNNGDGTFSNVSSITGLDFDGDGRAVARLDWDADGDLDLFLASRTGPRLRYLQNRAVDQAGERRSIALELIGTGRNRDAIGARVELYVRGDEAPRLASVRAGEGFLAQSSKRLHFGLQAGELPEHALVRWPGATEPERFVLGTDYSAGTRSWTLVRGGEMRTQDGDPSGTTTRRGLDASVPLPPAPKSRARVVLSAPLPMPEIAWKTDEGADRSLFALGAERTHPQPLLITLWASWCAPCIGELRDLARRADEVRAAGLGVLALSLDDAETEEAARLFLHNLAWPFARGAALPESIDLLDVLRGVLLDREDRLPVPTSFLVDAEGRLRVLYVGPVTTDTLLADVALCTADAEAQRAASTPFPGVWRNEPWEADLPFFEAKLLARGYRRAARQFHIGQMDQNLASDAELHQRFARTLGEAGRNAEAVRHYRAALEADPYLLDAWRDLGVVLYRLSDFDGAVDAYNEALRLSPDDAVTIYQLGLTHLRRADRAAVRHQVTRLRALEDPRADELETWIERLPSEDGEH